MLIKSQVPATVKLRWAALILVLLEAINVIGCHGKYVPLGVLLS